MRIGPPLVQHHGVSIHAPAWGATRPSVCIPPYLNPVSIHAPAWGATRHSRCCDRSAACGFNPRARVGRDPRLGSSDACPPEFQSTRPRGARPAVPALVLVLMPREFQSTRPRGARPHSSSRGAPAGAVSIHAPAWGATPGRHAAPGSRLCVSIHAPAWGATRSAVPSSRLSPGRFNPRARVGRDPGITDYLQRRLEFQSTRPRGARPPGPSCFQRAISRFQSTRPRGARPSPATRAWLLPLSFQSTRPRGARPEMQRWVQKVLMPFQSTRPRGARPPRCA